MAFTWLDNAIIAILVLSVIISLIRGFVKEAFSLLIWLSAFIVAARFATPLSDLFAQHLANNNVRLGLSFLVLFVATLIIGGLLNFLLCEIVVKTGLSGTNRLLGLVFGFLRGVILVALLIMLAQFSALPQSNAWKHSLLIPKISPVAQWLKVFVPENLDNYFKVGSAAKSKQALERLTALLPNKLHQG